MGFETSAFKLTTGAGTYKTLKSDSSGTANWSNFYTTPAGTYTVAPSGGDFTTIQAALDRMSQSVIEGAVTISVPSGTWSESLTIDYMPYGHLVTLQGDTRVGAGQFFPLVISSFVSNVGGTTWQVTLDGTVPSGFGAGDYIVLCGTSNLDNTGRFLVTAVTSTQVSFTNASGIEEEIAENARIVFCPNRVLSTSTADNLSITDGALINMTGFTLLNTSAASSGVVCIKGAIVTMTQTVVYGSPANGIQANYGGIIRATGGKCSFVLNANAGVQSMFHGTVMAEDSMAANNSLNYSSFYGSTVLAQRCYATKATFGYVCGGMSSIYADNAKSIYNSYGWYCYENAYIAAPSTDVLTYDNETADYSPAVSGTEGNNAGIIVFS